MFRSAYQLAQHSKAGRNTQHTYVHSWSYDAIFESSLKQLNSNFHFFLQYCPIPMIAYPVLENELFCDIFYLRNLCNISKFPDWPISNPLKLLKEVLMAWRTEVEKKPSSMTAADALAVLGKFFNLSQEPIQLQWGSVKQTSE